MAAYVHLAVASCVSHRLVLEKQVCSVLLWYNPPVVHCKPANSDFLVLQGLLHSAGEITFMTALAWLDDVICLQAS